MLVMVKEIVTFHVDPVVGKCSEGEGGVCMEGC